MIISRTPFRISFLGGGTDFPEWFKENDGLTISTSIDKYAYISLRKLPPFFSHKHRIVYTDIELCDETRDIKHPSVRECIKFLGIKDGLEIHYDGDLPSRSGLGSSSSFTVGLLLALKAYQGQIISQKQLADLSILIERSILQESGGLQDQIAVSHGGLNALHFNSNGHYYSPIVMPPKSKKEFEDSLVLFFTGKSRIADAIERKKMETIRDKRPLYQEMLELAREGLKCLSAYSFSPEVFGKLLNESWKIKKAFAKEVSNSHLDELYEQGIAAGAYGGKILGAGGGGFLLFVIDAYRKEQFISAMGHLLNVPFRFDANGATLALYQP